MAALALALCAAAAVSAHRQDEYLQAARIALAPGILTIDLDLTPGIAIAPAAIGAIDIDADGIFSTSEQARYARIVAERLRVHLDEVRVTLTVASVSSSPPEEFTRGVGTLRLQLTAPVPGLSPGTHALVFANNNEGPDGHSLYLANALVPRDAHLSVSAQRRTVDQRVLTIHYSVDEAADDPPGRAAHPAGLAVVVSVLLLLTALARRG